MRFSVKEASVFLITGGIQVLYGILLYFKWGFTYLCCDGIVHTYIAKIAFENPTNLVQQVWLPLPHLLMMPFVLNRFLYTTGFADTFVNAAVIGFTCVLLCRMVRGLYGVVISVVYASNILTLMLTTAALTEPLAILFAVWAVYLFSKYLATSKRKYFLSTSAVLIVGEFTRYEIWVLALVITLIFAYKEIRSHRPHNLGLIYLPFIGTFLWIFAETAIYRDPLEFLSPNVGYYLGQGYVTYSSPLASVIGVFEKAREGYEISIILSLIVFSILSVRVAGRPKLNVNMKRVMVAVIVALFVVTLPIQSSFYLKSAPVDSFAAPYTYSSLNDTKATMDNVASHIHSTVLVSTDTELPTSDYFSVLSGYNATIIDEYSNQHLFMNASMFPWKYTDYVIVNGPFNSVWPSENSYYHGAFFDYLYYKNETWYQNFTQHYHLIMNITEYSSLLGKDYTNIGFLLYENATIN
jgi:hypothetical protein